MMIRGTKKAVTIHQIVLYYRGRGGGPPHPTITDGFRHASSTIGKCGTTKTPPPSTVVLLRHGQSLWNKIPTFSGWCDVPLTDLGIEQARCAAGVMKKKGLNFDAVYVSQLRRAYESGEAVLEVMGNTAKASSKPVKPVKAWELNERQYVYNNHLCNVEPRYQFVVVGLTQFIYFLFECECKCKCLAMGNCRDFRR